MTEHSPFPDVEAVCVAALKDADVADGRAYGAKPADPTYPLIVVERQGGIPPVPRRVDRARIQVTAWAESKADAYDAAEAARLALHAAEATVFQDLDAYVTAVEVDLGFQWLPDPETAQPRYIFVVGVTAHHHESA